MTLSRYMSNPNITLTLIVDRLIVTYSSTFRLLIYRGSARNRVTLWDAQLRIEPASTEVKDGLLSHCATEAHENVGNTENVGRIPDKRHNRNACDFFLCFLNK